MTLRRRLASLIVVGGLVSLPVVVSACGTSSSTPNESDSAAMPMGDEPMADHSMMMDLGPSDAEFDLRFIDGMILHHQGAVDMAESALQNSQRGEVKQLAEDIIAAQQIEIDRMMQWRQTWYPDAGEEPVMYHAAMGHSMTMTSDMQAAMMMSGDLGTADNEFDLRFINGMIPHHEGALAMAQDALEKSSRPEVQQLAQDIVSSQQIEIDQMEQWRQEWYGQ
ncbi:DUF305 domain-containing protein [Nodosilinea sp. LEGE 06152]|uniref:DUF305 domain-containing protein n=1 Tax=Nodosilinea sp. LEGE 06152 TaxID=2777966 RepID=UPI00187F103F|nr:DUF305 domain-containing protein [Nodosilinea sp. LEGE 06152]MBE9156448.1 DUF305 domain-containing protein [Nodosilinea sp. LEGE 06152]